MEKASEIYQEEKNQWLTVLCCFKRKDEYCQCHRLPENTICVVEKAKTNKKSEAKYNIGRVVSNHEKGAEEADSTLKN